MTVGNLEQVVAAVHRLQGKGSTAVVVPDSTTAALAALSEAGIDALELADEGLTAAVTVAAASAVKGLEFDHVILLEPADLPLRVLYVAMTRAVTSLTLVHDRPLPPELGL